MPFWINFPELGADVRHPRVADAGAGLPTVPGGHGVLLLSSAMLSFSYLLSAHTFAAVRSTWLVVYIAFRRACVVQEVLQNCACCGLLATGSGILGLHTTLFLWPMYLIIPYFQSYPAMLAATICGSVCALVHGIDAIIAFRSRISNNR
ncbi:hypothetical protein LAZ67_X001778 [Cordylochernes scorpioides]|uniref:Uncharacterized protein n=1 Tax=Cordylochernes scorpioides TaxID=51811 RepID=A0ABY6LVY5_9ARAC|nr:hypothetical protein LAZ67_X001778 [Cordylochernes scorpioides]